MARISISTLEELSDHLHKSYSNRYPRGPPNFVIMYDDESGCNVGYVKDMPLKRTRTQCQQHSGGGRQRVRSAKGNRSYSGFVKITYGPPQPITVSQLTELLNRYGYSVEGFIRTFLKPG